MSVGMFAKAFFSGALAIGLVGACAATHVTAEAETAVAVCRPLGLAKTDLLELRAAGFQIEDDDTRAQFALGLIDCFADTDPELRDGVGYEGLSTLLRAEQLSDETVIALAEAALASLMAPPDAAGVRQPFAALGLSEIARADRVGGMFSEDLRARLVSEGAAYLRGVRDYRGFIEGEGWRHGVAHASDLMLQLALNEAVTRAQLDEMLGAIASQIIPAENHAYTFGEFERLARPVMFIAMRKELSDEEWTAWFADVSDPAPFESWGDVFSSEQGLARRHNLNAFAHALYVRTSATPRAELVILQELSLDILKTLA